MNANKNLLILKLKIEFSYSDHRTRQWGCANFYTYDDLNSCNGTIVKFNQQLSQQTHFLSFFFFISLFHEEAPKVFLFAIVSLRNLSFFTCFTDTSLFRQFLFNKLITKTISSVVDAIITWRMYAIKWVRYRSHGLYQKSYDLMRASRVFKKWLNLVHEFRQKRMFAK